MLRDDSDFSAYFLNEKSVLSDKKTDIVYNQIQTPTASFVNPGITFPFQI